jgi:hypothetical protein
MTRWRWVACNAESMVSKPTAEVSLTRVPCELLKFLQVFGDGGIESERQSHQPVTSARAGAWWTQHITLR